MEPLRILWSKNDLPLTNGALYLPVSPAGKTAGPLRLKARTNAHERGTYETLSRLVIFLSADPDTLSVLDAWASQGAGIRLSVDQGISWKRLRPGMGLDVGPLGPFDTLELELACDVPASATPSKIVFYLDTDCDVL